MRGLHCPTCGKFCKFVRQFRSYGSWELVIEVWCKGCGKGYIY